MSQIKWCLAAVLGLCVLGIPATFHGDVTEVNRLPTGQILVGMGLDYEVVADNPTGDYMWDWRCPGNPPGSWSNPEFQDWEFFLIYADRVGTFDDRFWAKEEPEDPYSGDPPVWNSKTVQESVLGPNQGVVASGTDVDSTDEEVEVRFAILRDASQIGGYIDGKPQERIILINHINDTTYFSPGWPGWLDPKPDEYYWDESTARIVDVKQFTMSGTAVQNAPVGTVLADVYHSNRLVILDCSGEDQYFEFPAIHFQKIKTGADTWKLVEVEE